MKLTENGHPTTDEEPTEAMILAGAKAAVDQLYHKGNVWDRPGYITNPEDHLNAVRYAWKAMEAVRNA